MRSLTRSIAAASVAACLGLAGAATASAAPTPITFSGAASASSLSANLTTGALTFNGTASTAFTGTGAAGFTFGAFATPISVGTFGPR